MLPDYPEALAAALRAVSRLDPSTPRQRLLTQATGTRLASTLTADRDQPPFDRATMDGYALRAADAALPESRLNVIADVPAGAAHAPAIAPGHAARIATGAPLPPAADAVVRHEWTDRAHPVVTIRAPRPVRPGDNVHPRAADARAGDVLAESSSHITPLLAAAAAAVGVTRALVTGRPACPALALLTSGDEVVPPETPTHALSPAQIRSSNGPLLEALAPHLPATLISSCHVPDDAAATRTAVEAALAEADILVTVGGVSAGERDRFPGAFDSLALEPFVQGAAIQPGRPIYVAAAPRAHCLVVALPGNPVSVLACTHLFLWPLARALAGLDPALPWTTVRLAESVQPNPQRRLFRPARRDSSSRAHVPSWAGSGDLMHALTTDGLVQLAPAEHPVAPGSEVPFLPFAWNVRS